MCSLRGVLSAVEACWEQTAGQLWRSSEGVSLPAIAAAARQSVEEALFLDLCRARGLLPKLALKQLRPLAVERLGRALFQLRRKKGVGYIVPERPEGCFAQNVPDPFFPDLFFPPGGDTRFALDGLRFGPALLGQVHHRLLCRGLRPGSGGRVHTDRSTAAAKAAGVFYTPEYVTRYMAARAIESRQKARCDGGRAKPPRIVDPACGCGAFLLAAYGHLRDRAVDKTTDQLAWRKNRPAVIERLHGVDLDGEAVLIARRALWLATADEPAGPLSAKETDVFFETIRPGNALVGPTLDSRTGTFDVVLGNPPYRRELGAKALLEQIAQTEFGRRWRTARMDFWYYFAHRALELLRDEGRLSLIVSGYWTAGSGAAKLVEQLRREAHVEEIFDLDRLRVFDHLAGRHMILQARKTRGEKGATVVKSPKPRTGDSAEPLLTGRSPLVVYRKTPDELFRGGRIDLEPVQHDLLEALCRGTPLGRLGRVRQGIAENPAAVNRRTIKLLNDARAGRVRACTHQETWQVGEGVFVLAPEEVEALDLPEEERSLLRPYHQPRDLGRYYLAESPSRTLIYCTPQTCPEVRRLPTIHRHLARFRPIMEARRETRLGRRPWWQLHWPRKPSLWTADKILSVQMAPRPAFVAALVPVYVSFSVNVFVPDRSTREHLFYLTAVLNSRPLGQWFRHHAKRRGVGLEINGRVLAQTPIRRIDFADTSDHRMHDELVELAGQLMCRARACTHQEELERRIDTIVCRLYGLSKNVVRASTHPT